MIIGRDTAHLGPSAVRAGAITCSSAIISWLPANSNHQHVVCVNNVEVRTVKPGVYRHTITGNYKIDKNSIQVDFLKKKTKPFATNFHLLIDTPVMIRR